MKPTILSQRDLLILSVLADAPMHGYGMVAAVNERSGGSVRLDPANLYRILARMDEKGWVQAGPTGERRRTYTITRAGRQIFGADVQRLQTLLERLRPASAAG